MKWIDYREKLGIAFNDEEKFRLLKNKVCCFLRYLYDEIDDSDYRNDSFIDYFIMIGDSPAYCNMVGIINSFEESNSIKDLISKYIAFSNTIHKHLNNSNLISIIRQFLFNELDGLNISYEIIEDNDGIFLFPKGAKELDDALVSEVLEWLGDYPKAHKTYCIALRQYAEGVYIRDVADNLRKSLETFLQEFLNNTKNLETNKTEICRYLGGQDVDDGISGLFQPLINAYKNINDRIAKHNDRVDEKLLEFLLYQTGVLIRMVISIKKSE